MQIDLNQDGITREWRIGVGDMASEHMALRFSATRLGAIRKFKAMVRTNPGLIVDLRFVCDPEQGIVAGKAYRHSSPQDCIAEQWVDADGEPSGSWVPLTTRPTSSWDAFHACKWTPKSRVRRLTDNVILSEVA